jgi:hypothetical protein
VTYDNVREVKPTVKGKATFHHDASVNYWSEPMFTVTKIQDSLFTREERE